MTLGERRKQAKMTQEQLAERIGVRRESVARYETGERSPSPAVAERIAEALGMDIETMWRVLYRRSGDDDSIATAGADGDGAAVEDAAG